MTLKLEHLLVVAFLVVGFTAWRNTPTPQPQPDVPTPVNPDVPPQPKPPEPAPQPKPVTPEEPELVKEMRKRFGDNYADAERYAAFYAALSDLLSQSDTSAIVYRQAAADSMKFFKKQGLKSDYLVDFLPKYTDEFADLVRDSQWTPELKSKHAQVWRELAAACLAASKPLPTTSEPNEDTK